MTERDRASESDLQTVEIPQETKTMLVTVGVPRALALDGWIGPSLFTSELASKDRPLVPGTFVIGSVQEKHSDTSPVMKHAAFGIRPNGEVVLADLLADGSIAPPRFANSSLRAFLACLDVFHDQWHAIASSSRPLDAIAIVRESVRTTDAAAFRDADTYWSLWFEELIGEAELDS